MAGLFDGFIATASLFDLGHIYPVVTRLLLNLDE